MSRQFIRMIDSTTDESFLIQAAQGGDLTCFEELVRRYQRRIHASLVVRLNRAVEAEDLTQEVFIHAFRKLDQFDLERPFGPWLRGIAFNLLRNHWRKFRADAVGGNAELDLLIDHELGTSHPAGYDAECLEILPNCLAELEERSRELLHLRYHEEWSIRSLGEKFNRRHSAMTMWLHRIREQVSVCIERKTSGAQA